jgi:NAD(P)-dependent dehydrogenase (short-subunit alcohol dehydrogenase family)
MRITLSRRKSVNVANVGTESIVNFQQMNLPNLADKAWKRAKIGYGLSVGQISAFIKLRKKPPTSGCLRIDPQRRPVDESASYSPGVKEDSTLHGTCLIVGAGPKLGFSLARRFGVAGFDIAVARRQSDLLLPLTRELSERGVRIGGIRCDATSYPSVQRMFSEVVNMFGVPDCVVFNVEAYSPGEVQDISPSAFEDSWRGNCYAGFLVGQCAAKLMRDRGRGTIIYSGATASLRGKQGYINLAVGKAGLRALAQSMARELGPSGVHVCHVVLDGGMASMGPDDIAENYLHLHRQPANAWTHELDLRTSVEPW